MSNLNGAAYDAIAAQWAADRATSEPDELIKEFAKSLHSGDKVLDVGSGSGLPNAAYLSEQGINVTGIDVSDKLLKMAKHHAPKATFVQISITNFTSDHKYDGVVAWDSLFHLAIDEHEAVFRKIYSLLNRGGMFVFTHGGSAGEISGQMHNQAFTYSSLGPDKTKQLLESLGFRIIMWILDKSESNGYLKALVQK